MPAGAGGANCFFPGVMCDTDACSFEVSNDKLVKLEVILGAAVDTGSVAFATLQNLASKCTLMWVAYPRRAYTRSKCTSGLCPYG